MILPCEPLCQPSSVRDVIYVRGNRHWGSLQAALKVFWVLLMQRSKLKLRSATADWPRTKHTAAPRPLQLCWLAATLQASPQLHRNGRAKWLAGRPILKVPLI